jgi:phospholipid/cholesterol/gamma-HCH transport system substrate-binding protein
MDERVLKFRVGVMVISTMLLAGILIMLFSDAGSIVRPKYTIIIHFNEAPGVTEGTPVRKSGILIGRVTKVDFAQEGGVNVTVEINEDVVLYRNEVPQVSGSLLGGDVVIQFIKRTRPPALISPPQDRKAPDAQSSSGDPLEQKTGDAGQPAPEAAAPPPATPAVPNDIIQPGDYITGIVAPSPVEVITNLEGNLAGAVDTLTNAGNEVGKVAASINRLLDGNEANLDKIIANTETTLSSFQKVLDNIDDVIGNPEVRENLRRSVEELPQLLSDTRGAMNTVRTTVESVDRNLRNLEGFTAPLGEKGGEIVDGVDRTMKRLDELITELSDFGKKLNSGEGSLGKIMRDPELYQNLNRAAQNIAQLTCELRPVVADARVFADKIARHPELLGVRGAIKQSPGTK